MSAKGSELKKVRQSIKNRERNKHYKSLLSTSIKRVKNADKKGLLEISKEINSLVVKAKAGKLTPDEYTGGTISISNLGMYGISEFIAIINSPQSSILAVGSIQKILKLDNKKIQEVNVLKSTLSADHRALDGASASKLLKDFHDIIENPFDLWLQSKDMEVI